MLKSNLFKGSPGLTACEVHDSAHLTTGKKGDDVGRVQMALLVLDSAEIDRSELLAKTYGKSTANAVLAFKSKRRIINHSYQSTPDDIVGKMTIAALDREMCSWEASHRAPGDCNAGVRRSSPTPSFALASAIRGPGTQPSQIKKHVLRVYLSITKKAAVENGYPISRTVEVVKDCLSNFGMFLSLEFSLGVSFADRIDFDDDLLVLEDQVPLLRRASEILRPGFPSILRVIVCRMGINNHFGETYRHQSIGGINFSPFCLLNSQNVSLDNETMIHEMIHAALPDARRFEHDSNDNASVFFDTGRDKLGEVSRSHLNPQRAVDLSNGFFAI